MIKPGLAILTALIIAQPAAAAAAAPAPAAVGDVAPFAAHFQAEWKGIRIADSDLDLQRGATPGSYVYSWRISARGIFRIVYSDDLLQKSWFTLEGDHIQPHKYRAEDGSSSVELEFDWAAGRARGYSEKKPLELKIEAGTQDLLSIQVEVMEDLKNGTLPGKFQIIDKDEVKEFLYARAGGERLKTELGELDTVVVTSQREGGDRILRMWFAPSLGYVPVQAERTRGGKLEFAMRIKTLRR
jgi:hypothetical protein